VSVDVDVDGGLDVDMDLNLVATFDVQSILVSMATTPSSRTMPLRDKFPEFEHVERGAEASTVVTKFRSRFRSKPPSTTTSTTTSTSTGWRITGQAVA